MFVRAKSKLIFVLVIQNVVYFLMKVMNLTLLGVFVMAKSKLIFVFIL